jgi:peptidyl-prolyl cis-trans isomerase C
MRAARDASPATPSAATLLLFACACSERPTERVITGPLPPAVAAIVGSDSVSVGTVQRIARAQAISVKEARERAVSDALLAASVRAAPELAPRVVLTERSVLARALLERLRDEARALGPPRDDEVKAVLVQRWPELARPVSVRTSHAVVLVKSPADDAPARALATELAVELKGARTGAELIQRANAFPKQGLDIQAEGLPPVTPDGRLWDPSEVPPKPLNGSLDLDFTRAAHTLTEPGTQTGVVKTSFGYHVILLDERIPALELAPDELARRLADDVNSRRAKRALEALSSRLHAATPVSTERAADALTALVPVTP